jgi:predicted SprT family Zn-dependent metalloprotease
MDIQEAKTLGFQLLKKHDLDGDFHFLLDQATTKCGHCRTYHGSDGKIIRKAGILGKITLSTRFIQHNSLAQVTDTILHEIAHGVCAIRHGLVKGLDGKRQMHGPDWKKIALEFGAKPRSCAEGVYIPKFYQLVCHNGNCKLKGKKQYETNKSGDWPCKCCKKRLAVIPNDGVQIKPGGVGQLILFD